LGAGRQNSKVILKALMRKKGMAASLCEAFKAGGLRDWFLPSRDELDLMYKNLHAKGLGGFTNSGYWSSSEEYDAWFLRFGDGSPGTGSKDISLSVRAVRAF
jgi:hypothetical protein